MTTTETTASISTQLLRRLIEAAGKAPSPDNNQPWAFGRLDNAIQVFHRRERALPSDVRDMFSWIAIGAAIENLALAASANALATDDQQEATPTTSGFSSPALCHVCALRSTVHGLLGQREGRSVLLLLLSRSLRPDGPRRGASFSVRRPPGVTAAELSGPPSHGKCCASCLVRPRRRRGDLSAKRGGAGTSFEGANGASHGGLRLRAGDRQGDLRHRES